MTERERGLMGQHVVYWTALLEKGPMLAFGPVADPRGTWGLGLIEAGDEKEARALTEEDPVVKSGLGFRYEILPMPRLVMKK